MLFHAFFGFVTQCPVFCNFRCVCVCFRRLVERLENMRRSAVGNGLSQCLLCGEVFGLLSSPSVLCLDCCMKVCTKCGIETAGSQKRAQWLCKICSERREVWKRSGAWFYKALPKHIRPIKDSILDNRKQVIERREQLPVARSAPISYTWAQSKVNSSESDGSDAELSECSSDRKTFMSETNQRRDSGNTQLLEIHCQICTNTPHPHKLVRTNTTPSVTFYRKHKSP
uniref:Rabphilin 3A-like (without C2 domains) n=1 Tax=Cyprinus carpio TaxID=7962 RepID=A0A8C1WVP1_CYPCA